ncbi:hypothetical protein BCR41DRAFT_246476 [Lobosporangium transversale]|uniref:IPT/TIG domain-containing protein n=1 Tax=Lobosporangium transversale TaxID=64571 RepID=A0A1Y2GWI9_9FUNG|nr:hypothetical protein BCR41DRAFT_246476 [Lobosporangium transversale]ORZ23794.1 hypothetical protein BCR41DRAFT_246476 [Lobosporangium transversale]|eukprot:XP_021883608.1 hypothetical protein BCR41DRAFT_246476 [Lobosporangium transversale]
MSTTGMVDENDPMSNYSLEARILQKKDQLEELSATGTVISTPIVEEVRTGQQFLIKLHLSRKGPNQSLRYPSLRVGRREAINAAGEPRFEAEPLTLEIGIRLAKSGSVRKGACAKCCHKYGPSSPILVLLDQLSPSVTDPAAYAHVDTTTGSITMLAKVICSSTDHGERGNKDRYIFDFRLKRTSSMSTTIATSSSASPAPSDATDEDGEILSTFFTHPIMCSGHHKAKRTAYPHQRPSKVTKAGPTPKIKTIKRHKSAPNIAWPPQGALIDAENVDNLNLNGPIGSNNGFPSTINYLPEHLSQLPLVSAYTDPTNGEPRANINNQSLTSQSASEMEQHPISQHPRILEVRPDNGPIRKRTDVVLRGLFFREGMVPYFGVFPAQDIIVETSGLIICKVPESSMPGTVPITIVDSMNNSYGDLGQFTYTDDGETELLILQLQLRLAHRALEYLHTQATGQKGNVDEIMRSIPGLSNAPRSNGALMMDSSEPLLSLSEVEDSILEILNHIPKDMDISIQLEDGSNLLHLAILMGLHRLAIRLIEEGCDIESQDDYGMTPLMYAVFKGNELIARSLILEQRHRAHEPPKSFMKAYPVRLSQHR